MIPQVLPLPCAISDIFAHASRSGQITVADRYGLMAALVSDSLSEEDRQAIDRLLHAARRGRLKIVDELSAIAC
jgi:hypothetical protein